MRRLLSAVAVSGFLLAGVPAITTAQGLPGLTLFSGVKSENQLSYRLDFGGQTRDWDRYRLRIPGKKLKMAVEKFVIAYPDYYDGEFDTDEIEIKVGRGKGKKVKVSEVKWDKEGKVIEIIPEKPIPAGKSTELILSNVENPDFPGTFYFNCLIQSPGDKTALTRYVGTWIIGIN
ncbi:Protein of unknown function (DUF2808) [Rivularia sp. PCC 7116]|uniref:DUF2808 domain-containing protein n=1 Tax=Rivularia sp. PCC 7116 TaxID=373994 RepID=UPI00029EF852|nr:DUF2808 domain-containing protein [Rivularia sp. PCC 7116]AFY52791.1 Protein of unknown function (DUF2808) [Rivularia sp. PCC 7116]